MMAKNLLRVASRLCGVSEQVKQDAARSLFAWFSLLRPSIGSLDAAERGARFRLSDETAM